MQLPFATSLWSTAMTLPSPQRILVLFEQSAQQQFTMKKLLQHFAVPAPHRAEFRQRVRELVGQGRLVRLTCGLIEILTQSC